MTDYYVINLETGKLELHFEKATYLALPADQKAEIKSNFLWGRNSSCWISRAKEPNLFWAIRCAEKLGLQDAGKTGERISFAEQMERKAERADRRADRYEDRAGAAQARGDALQKPIRDMHGDIAFFTQPNINSSAGRAFTNRRNRMFAAFEKGFDEIRRSEYWKERAQIARNTAARKELQDKGFLCRRIKEQESNIRSVKKCIEMYEGYASDIENGRPLLDSFGGELRMSADGVRKHIEYYLDRLEVLLDKLGFYQECLDKLGGVEFSRDNIKAGYVVKVKRLGSGKVISTGPKNCKVQFDTFPLTVAYAEILAIVSAKEDAPRVHPFKVGETFTCLLWNEEKRKGESATFTIVRASEKSVTLRCGEEKPMVRKPVFRPWNNTWYITVTDYINGTWSKPAVTASAE